MKIKVLSVNISERKGTVKESQDHIILDENGVQGDAHAGSWHRQVSLLAEESIEKFSEEAGRTIKYGEFAENITTRGALLHKLNPFDRLVGEHVELEITQIGKKCHGDNCSIFREVGNCVMPIEGIFARVIRGGKLTAGDEFEYIPRQYKVLVITLSDRASRGEYKDKSGPLLAKLTQDFFNDSNHVVDVKQIIIPDDELALEENIKWAEENHFDIIFTSGGTGVGPRDITPDVVKRMLDKEIPGIMEYIRVKYGAEKPAALLSRGVAGVRGTMQIYTLPGSPKAIVEYTDEIFKHIHHLFRMQAGIDSH